ncbi:MAG: HIT domain-containing protein [Candidatus Paceibacterota bacterium]
MTENEDFYLIATLGQIIGGYVLVIPKEHVSCIGDLTNVSEKGREFLRRTVRSLWKEYGGGSVLPQVTTFEHGIVGQTVKHAHIHAIPAVINMTRRIQSDFPSAEIQEIQLDQLQDLYRERKEPYLFWTTTGARARVCWNPPAPPQYLRIIAADALGHPERANWREMDPELDKKLGEETVRRLKPYFS